MNTSSRVTESGGGRLRPGSGRALSRLVEAVGEYARLRTRPVLGATLKRVTDEAAITLPPDLRQQIDRALSAPGQGQPTPLLKLITLLAEARKVLEGDFKARGARLRDSVRRSGALVDGKVLERALAVLGEEGGAIADLGALLDRRRTISLVQADIDRREEEIKQRWRKARAEAQALIGAEAAQAADTGLADEDFLPVVEALDEIEARASLGSAPVDPLARARLDLEKTLEATQEFLAAGERDWVRRALSTCPAAGESAGAAVGAGCGPWVTTLAEIGAVLEGLAASRGKAMTRLEETLGEAGAAAGACAGHARLGLLVEALGQRRGAAEGRLEVAWRRLLEAEWDLSRAIWEDGPWASAPALLEARRAFLESHRGRELPDEDGVREIRRRTSVAAARVRLEASWRRRWLLRHGKAATGERDREAGRLGGRIAAQLKVARDDEVEARCRETEAGLRASLAALCVRIDAGGGGADDEAERARVALEYGEPSDLDRTLHELRG